MLVAAGVLVMAGAVGGGLADPDLDPGGVLLFLAAVLVGHDVVWMAAVLATGAVITRLVPPRHRPAARTGAICAATVTLVAFPLVLGFGRPADNPSALPLPYGRNLAVLLLAVACAAAVRIPKGLAMGVRAGQVGSVARMGHRVLVVDDDPTVSDVLRRYLEQAGCEVRLAADGADGLAAIAAQRPDLVVLDLMMPGIDGLEVCRRVRRQLPDLPVVMLTALGEEADRVLGLEVGADDYVTKPFSPRELVLRIRSVLRRTAGHAANPAGPARLTDAELTVDTARRIAESAGSPLALTVREFDLLVFLMRHPGRAWSRTDLLEKVWGWQFGDHSTVTVHVRRLREKVEQDPAEPRRIRTVWGVGYRYDPLDDQGVDR